MTWDGGITELTLKNADGKLSALLFEVNMSIIQNGSTTVTYDVSPEQIIRLIARDLEVDGARLSVEFIMGDDPNAHPMDQNPQRRVTNIKVILK